jgi:hypothetical protein
MPVCAGCVVVESRGFAWPHDAILLPSTSTATSWRAEGIHSLSVAVAELNGKRVQVLDAKLGDLSARGFVGMYG